jgi:exodeoxyribonuclease-5
MRIKRSHIGFYCIQIKVMNELSNSSSFTKCQATALEAIEKFVRPGRDEAIFVLTGSAGTGKTTLMQEVIHRHADAFETLLLAAPTNKAAKVLSTRTNMQAGTLHNLLFKIEDQGGEPVFIKRKLNAEQRCLIIADEASMISDRTQQGNELFTQIRLLTALVQFVQEGHPGNKLILVGDPCQLPPVGYESYEQSPALDVPYLQNSFGKNVATATLKEVRRQDGDSYILKGATALRKHILEGAPKPVLMMQRTGHATGLLRQYIRQYDAQNPESMAMLAFTNRDVNWWNNAIRGELGIGNQPLMPGSQVIIDQNWSDGSQVLLKSEMAMVKSIGAPQKEFAGLHFMPVELETRNISGEMVTVQSLALLEHLHSERGYLLPEQERFLRAEAMRLNPKYRENKRARDDRFVGALRLRYGYAFTCHKAQGSEYRQVALHPYQPANDPRWLYTAITRAKDELWSY